MAADGGVGGGVAGADVLGGSPGSGAALNGGQGRSAACMRSRAQWEVDRGRAGRPQAGVGGRQRGVGAVVAQGQGDAEGGGGADQRGAAHLHVADRGGGGLEAIQARRFRARAAGSGRG